MPPQGKIHHLQQELGRAQAQVSRSAGHSSPHLTLKAMHRNQLTDW